MGDGGERANFILHGNRQPEATLGEWTHSPATIQCVCENVYVCVLCISTFVALHLCRLHSQHPIHASVQASVVKLKLFNIICSN